MTDIEKLNINSKESINKAKARETLPDIAKLNINLQN